MGNIWAKENVVEAVGRWKRRELKDRDISNHVALSPVARLFSLRPLRYLTSGVRTVARTYRCCKISQTAFATALTGT